MGIIVNFSHRKIQQGDIQEFEKLFHKMYASLCHYALKFLNDMDSAEEVVQDLFYHYWKNREHIKINTSLKAYLYQATKNRCLKVIKHNAVRQKHIDSTMHNAEEQVNQAQTLESDELAKIIEKTLSQLPERRRKIFIMSRFDGLKYKEIAKKLSISVKTVEADMGKALKLFRVNLKDY
jgi:RNA polymerase sigma-70 factor (ECF subfamily)